MARKVKKFTDYEKEELEKEQAYLSNERTLLSYIRTALTFILFGLAIVTLVEHENRNLISGVLIVVGILFGFYGYRVYKKRQKIIERL